MSALSRKLARKGVTIHNVCPGMHETDRLIQAFGHMATSSGCQQDEVVETAKKGIPAGRFGAPEEFGAVCAFLRSQQADFITGQSLVVDGGQANSLL